MGAAQRRKPQAWGLHESRTVSDADRSVALGAGALPRAGGSESGTAPPRMIESDQLMRGASLVAIRHENCVYILRKTRFGKLILTK
jgi:hemin uptake protein HemP